MTLRGRDDPGIFVDGIARGREGQRLGEPCLIGTTQHLHLRGTQFGLYESNEGDLVGLYRKAEPNVILMAADFTSGWVLGGLPVYRTRFPRRSEETLKALTNAAGIPLEYLDYPISDWR